MKKIIFSLLLSLYVLTVSCKENSVTTLALDWYPNSNHGGIYTALEKEYFENDGFLKNTTIFLKPCPGEQRESYGKPRKHCTPVNQVNSIKQRKQCKSHKSIVKTE